MKPRKTTFKHIEAMEESLKQIRESFQKLSEVWAEYAEEITIAIHAFLSEKVLIWEDIKRLIEDINEYFEKQEEERKKFKPPIKHNDFPLLTKVFKSQVMNNKPLFIRIRSNC